MTTTANATPAAPARTEFDYEAAWTNLARPAWERTPDAFKALAGRVDAESADLHQHRDTLDVLWPKTDLRDTFAALAASDPYGLAMAARAAYFVSHWFYSESGAQRPFAQPGWKFANYADQVLTAALGLPRNRSGKTPNGASFAVFEGFLRVQFNRPGDRTGFWLWEEVGPATPEVLAAVRGVTAPEMYASYEKAQSYLADAKAAAAKATTPEAQAWLTASTTYVAEYGWYSKRQDERRKARKAEREAFTHAAPAGAD